MVLTATDSNSLNLDLSDVPSEDVEGLATRIEQFYKADSTTKMQLTGNFQRNHLMLDGKQWLVKNNGADTGRMWSELKVTDANRYIPRPTTNYLFDAYQTIKSYLVQHRPRSTVRPNTDTFKDKQAAKLAELVAECNWERLKEEMNYEYAAGCGFLYGTVLKKDYWDTTALMMAKVPRMAEQPIIEPQTGGILGYEEREVLDPATGETVYDDIPLGDANTDIIEPYRIALDPLARDLNLTCRWLMEYGIQSMDWTRQMFDRQEPGYTGLVDQVQPEQRLSDSMQRFFDLRTSSGVKGGTGGLNNGGGDGSMIDNCVVVKEYYERPSMNFPKGRLIVVANGVTLYAGDSPYEGDEAGDWHPYSEFRYEVVPGRFWGKTPFDDATELQKRLNSIDATVILTRKTMAIPQKLIPKGSGIKKGEWTGRPGQNIEYRTGEKPETVPSAGVDGQVFQERAQVLEDLKQITGAIDILKGDRPPGVTAASALEMLYEVGTGKLKPMLDRWKLFIESSQKKQLKLIARKYKEPREQFIKMLMAKNKSLPRQSIEKFIGEDLHDNCNIRIEAGSNIPKLESTKKANLLQVAQLGALQLESPENRMKFLEEMGITGYSQDVSPDVKRAEYENDVMDNVVNDPSIQPVILACDLHEIHTQVHERRMKEPGFVSLPKQVIDAYNAHIQQHKDMEAMQKQQMMMEAAMTGQPPQQGSPADKQQLSGKGKGIPDGMAKAQMGADLPPDAKVQM